ncbi:MAG: (2Fe-2S) ferredoxin domain-containing protein [Deltaproteobacteria bacterium]|nr:(2Fe-2S) ferredoxin domain-containing protein [Deltaproteobacteria bacterium]MBW2050618.1 (2Fe-2S) ferredoxin domain-containing protein [Deltaproteobacteria bacterium]MBW2139488.1 (2Fe-2S) ferredoxin domain-containing protein [Deltaproteobacteria bacterium]MBW2322563.1 (2Fe-2S) ferredoxin domain-containing protein [Deltaproteobacteria bacterium]
MPKLKLDDLKKIKEQVLKDTSLRTGGATAKVTVHMGTCGIASGARQVMDALMDEVSQSDRQDIAVTTSGCIGLCSEEPIVTVELLNEEAIRYHFVDPNKMRQIFKRHILEGEVQDEFVMAKGSEHSN